MEKKRGTHVWKAHRIPNRHEKKIASSQQTVKL